MPRNNELSYADEQRVDHFKPGDKVVVRPSNVWTDGSILNSGEVYTVDSISINNERRGSGQLHLVERQDGGFNGGGFGHLLFKHFNDDDASTEDKHPPVDSYKPGDRVLLTYMPDDPHHRWHGAGTVERVDMWVHVRPDSNTTLLGGFTADEITPLVEKTEDGPLDRAEETSDALVVGDRVRIKPGAGHEAFDGKTGVIVEVAGGTTAKLALDSPPSADEGRICDDPNGGFWLLSSLERAEETSDALERTDEDQTPVAPDLSDAEVRKTLPIEEAYPIGSVWKHHSYGGRLHTVVGHGGDRTIKVDWDGWTEPLNRDWPRGALDSNGTLVSLPDDSSTLESNDAPIKVGDRIRVIEAMYVKRLPAEGTVIKVDAPPSEFFGHPFRVQLDDTSINGGEAIYAKVVERIVVDEQHGAPDDEVSAHDARVDSLRDEVDTLRNEITMLKQAAADERRRLCGEIDSLKAERDSCRAGLESAQGRYEEVRERLTASEQRSEEGWNLAAQHLASLDFAKHLLGPEEAQRVDDYTAGWKACNES